MVTMALTGATPMVGNQALTNGLRLLPNVKPGIMKKLTLADANLVRQDVQHAQPKTNATVARRITP